MNEEKTMHAQVEPVPETAPDTAPGEDKEVIAQVEPTQQDDTSTIEQRIERLTDEVEKLEAHRDHLLTQRQDSANKLRQAGEDMQKAQQDAVLQGSDEGYTQARKTFNELAEQDVVLHQQINSMKVGIEARRAQLNPLRTKQNAKKQRAVQTWARENAASIEEEFTQALARFMALRQLTLSVEPSVKAAIPSFISGNSAYAALYTETKRLFRQDAGL